MLGLVRKVVIVPSLQGLCHYLRKKHGKIWTKPFLFHKLELFSVFPTPKLNIQLKLPQPHNFVLSFPIDCLAWNAITPFTKLECHS